MLTALSHICLALLGPFSLPSIGVVPVAIRSKIDMMKATRLTREGRLGEAVALLRDALTGGSSSGMPVSESEKPRNAVGQLFGQTRTQGALDALAALAGRAEKALLKVAPALSPVPKQARFESYSFSNEAGSRTYKLYVPSGYDGRALPLVVMLHGCTQSPDDFAAGTRMNLVAEEHGFFVAYPEQAKSANVSKCWNWFSKGDQQRGEGEPSLIAGITQQIMCDFTVDPARIYVAGLSAGGAAAAIMGATYPDLYAAIGVHSGLACGAARDMQSAFSAMHNGGALDAAASQRNGANIVPAIVFHGDEDKTVNPVNGDQVIAQFKAAANLDCKVSRGRSPGGMDFTRTLHADETGQVLLEQWVLHGAGHAWSGGSSAGSYTAPDGPDASREMVRFFLQHEHRP